MLLISGMSEFNELNQRRFKGRNPSFVARITAADQQSMRARLDLKAAATLTILRVQRATDR
jgi:hypothetical protein